MNTLGENGRFGNQIFQYAFMRYYARQHGFQFQVPHWAGQDLFGFLDAPITVDLPRFEVSCKADLDRGCVSGPIFGVDFWGYFQDVSLYSGDKDFFFQLFSPKLSIKNELEAAWSLISDKSIICLHMRYGDYGYGEFYETRVSWVLNYLESIWDGLKSPVLYLATDDIRCARLFKSYSVVTAKDIFGSVACPGFYCDFWALSNANHTLIIANSSFSFAASMLNRNSPKMLRPSLLKKALIPFDPWRDDVLLHEENLWQKIATNFPRIRLCYNCTRRFLLFYLCPFVRKICKQLARVL